MADSIEIVRLILIHQGKKKSFRITSDQANAIEHLIRPFFAMPLSPDTPRIRLRLIRSTHGLTQAEFSRRIGVSQSDISKIESGRREVGLHLAKIIGQEFKVALKHLWDTGGGRKSLTPRKHSKFGEVAGRLRGGG